MTRKLTRRQLAGIAAGSAAASAVVLKAIAQAPAPTPDWYKEALDSHRENSAILAAVQIPMSIEPAFHFKA